MTSYVDLAAALAVPTAEQTREFAVFVTAAHSWYKHLSPWEMSPFVFYLDPNAGRAMIREGEDDVRFIDHVDESSKFHYTWQLTSEYRRRFGFWNYEAPYGASFLYHSAEGPVDTAGTGLRVLFPPSEWLEVPRSLADAGTARVSALMWSDGSLCAPSQLARDMRVGTFFSSRGLFSGPDKKWLAAASQYASAWPEDLQKAFRAICALWAGEDYGRELAEVQRELEALYDSAHKGPPGTFAANLEAGGHSRLYDLARKNWELTRSRAEERRLIEPLLAALDRERERQIEGMLTAMERFLAALRQARLH